MTKPVSSDAEYRHLTHIVPLVYSYPMLRVLGIESRLQLAMTGCIVALLVVTTLGGSGGAPWVFFTYRTLLIVIALLAAIGSRRYEMGISRVFLTWIVILYALMLVSVLRIPASHFDAYYLWFRYAFFAAAFLNLANYARYQSARWRAVLLGVAPVLGVAHIIPDLIKNRAVVAGFSTNNPNYFATFLLIGLAATISAAVYTTMPKWRIAAASVGAVVLFGVIKTSSRGATLAAVAMLVVAAVRARGRIPRQVWLVVGLGIFLSAVLASPYMIRKFFDRGEIDPYNYARTEIWRGAFQVIAQSPVLGVGFAQYFHVSKRFTLPVDGAVARYLKRAQMAHNEYLQHVAELGFPAALLLFFLLGYLLYVVWKRSTTVWPEFRCFSEAALLTATGVGIHALVDNCWTIPVTASGLVVVALADPLPLRRKLASHHWTRRQFVFAGTALLVLYVFSTAIPGMGLYYNDLGHKAYDRSDFATAERYHRDAIALTPNHSLFIDNLGMVYLEQSVETNNPALLAPAKEYFRRAIQANPRSLDPHIHMETALLRSLTGDWQHDRAINEELLRVDRELLEIDPFIPFPRKNLAAAYYYLGEFDRAMQELHTAIHYEPNYVPGYLQIAAWYRERGDTQASDRYTATALEIVNRYRNFKPTQPYEFVLLARPEETQAALTAPSR